MSLVRCAWKLMLLFVNNCERRENFKSCRCMSFVFIVASYLASEKGCRVLENFHSLWNPRVTFPLKAKRFLMKELQRNLTAQKQQTNCFKCLLIIHRHKMGHGMNSHFLLHTLAQKPSFPRHFHMKNHDKVCSLFSFLNVKFSFHLLFLLCLSPSPAQAAFFSAKMKG